MPRKREMKCPPESESSTSFTGLQSRLAGFEGEKFSFYVGDTWVQPPSDCRLENITIESYPDVYRYGPPHGLLELRQQIAEISMQRTGLQTSASDIVVTVGATGAAGVTVGALMEPGDSLLILAPFWPLIHGIANSYGVTPIEVPFFDNDQSERSAVEILDRFVTDSTSAIFLNNPHNPTGKILDENIVKAVVDWASERGLWIISDEVYRDLIFAEEKHTHCRPLAPSNVIELFSFSKAYGMAGNRVGYIVGPPDAIGQIHTFSMYTSYGTSIASQVAALRILRGTGDSWLEETRRGYSDVAKEIASILGVEAPQAGLYFFLDLRDRLSGRSTREFIEQCASRGVIVSPGSMFGDYEDHIRICFASEPPEKAIRGVRIVAEELGT